MIILSPLPIMTVALPPILILLGLGFVLEGGLEDGESFGAEEEEDLLLSLTGGMTVSRAGTLAGFGKSPSSARGCLIQMLRPDSPGPPPSSP